MENINTNGANTIITSQVSNVENPVLSNVTNELTFIEEDKSKVIVCNSDTKITIENINDSSGARSKLRKEKAFADEDDSKKSPTKQKSSNLGYISSGETEEFNGFELKNLERLECNRSILKKLIVELESINELSSRRRKNIVSIRKSNKTSVSLVEDTDEHTTDSDDQKMIIEPETCNIFPDESSLKSEKFTNSSVSASSNKLRKNRSSRGTSPGSTIRQKVSVDITNSAYREPFKYGWRRELVYRAGTSENQARRMADIYYYTPEGKKVRSYREVIEHLATSELTIDNFTFFKEPLGVNDSEKEVIRDAKKARDSITNKSVSKISNKILESTPVKKKKIKKVDTSVPNMPSPKVLLKTSKSSSTFKVKLPAKKSPKSVIKKETKSSAPSINDDASSDIQWSVPLLKRNSKTLDKISPTKAKVANKKKLNQLEVDTRQYFMFSICAGYYALSRVFQYLKVQEILRAARVCRMWRDLAAHPSLWKTVRMKNSQVTDWDGLVDTLKYRGTQHLDLRKMLIVGESDNMWKKFVSVIPKVTSLIKLEMCKCPAKIVEDVMANCPQLQTLCAASIKCECINLEFVSNLKNCNELKLKAMSGMSINGDLSPLINLLNLKHLSLTSVKELGKKNIEVLQSLENLVTLELGECSDFPDKFGTVVIIKLKNLEKLRLEKGQGSCCTFDILDGISKLKSLTQLELVNFDVKNGFDKSLANCKNIKRLLIIPTYVSQSATSNNMILGGVTELSKNLTHFVWGVTQELLRVTELFVDQCNQMSKQITGDSIPVLKPVPCLKLIEDILVEKKVSKDDKQQTLSNPQVEILPLPHLQKLLLTALPTTRVKILKIPFHATWRQSISDSTLQ